MKIIKRVLMLIVCCALLFSAMPVTGNAAAQDNFNISCGSASVYAGSDVTLDIRLNNNPGFSALNIALVYDTDYITQKSITNIASSLYMTTGSTIVWDGAENYTSDGILATVNFSIAEDAPVGDYEVKIIFMGASDDNFEEVQAVAKAGKITVKCRHTNTTFVSEKPADCTNNGYTAGFWCNDCETYISGHEIIYSKGHTSSDWIIDEQPTCSNSGRRHRECTVCGEILQTFGVPANGHQHVAIDSITEHPHTVTYKCSVCGHEKKENPSLSSCVECNFSITLTDSDNYKLEAYIGEGTTVSIPASYKSIDIKSIGPSCFRDNAIITSIEIEEGITTIGSLAFMNCSSLKKVIIPASVTHIGDRAFYDFTGVIYCTSGSAAHEYAVENNIKYVLVTYGEQEKPIKETDDTKIDYENLVIRTNIQNCGDIIEILELSESATAVPIASYVYGGCERYGTGTTIAIFDGNRYIGDFTLIVNGDINGDSVCDVLDSAYVALVSNGLKTFDGAYKMAADSNADDIVDITDYQDIVNKVVS